MDLACDAGAFGEHGVEAQLHVADAHAVDLIPNEEHGETEQRAEPPGLPGVREHADVERGAGLVPDAVVVGGEHMEGVAAGWNVGVVSDTARSGIDPLGIESIQPIAVAHARRRDKAEAGVMQARGGFDWGSR